MNARLLGEGLAYAELYATMPKTLIERMRQIVKNARQEGSGMWPHESVGVGNPAAIDDFADLPELVLFPKLYRRLVKYFDEGNTGLAGFDSWIRADRVKRDDQALLPDGEVGNLHDLYRVEAGQIELQFLPEDLTFQPDPA